MIHYFKDDFPIYDYLVVVIHQRIRLKNKFHVHKISINISYQLILLIKHLNGLIHIK